LASPVRDAAPKNLEVGRARALRAHSECAAAARAPKLEGDAAMAKRKQADAEHVQDVSGGYEVGYGRPPQHTRFKRGQSGNPRGRRPGQPNMKTAIQRVLTAKEIDALLRSHIEQGKNGNVASAALVLSYGAKAVTGEGADIIVFDDPHNVRKIATSDAAREATLQFWDESLPSRLNDPEQGAFITIMQRLHDRDLSGHILERESGWTHLCLPAEYESNHPFPIRTSVTCKATGEIWRDPRQEGELLWPQKFPRAALQAIAKDASMSSHVAAGQLQQRPTARDGGMFKRAWFAHEVAVFDLDSFVAAHGLELVRAWDLAWSGPDCGGDPDFSVGVLMGLEPDSNLCYILDVVRGRWAAKQIEQMVRSKAACDGEACSIRIPQDPGAGKFVAHHLASKLAGYEARVDPEHASKPQRAAPLAAHAENGFVVLARASWNQSFVDELCAFPNGAHDDQVDAAAAAYRALMSRVRYTAVAA
jgi:predicted phage terminase large subunit-like protein